MSRYYLAVIIALAVSAGAQVRCPAGTYENRHATSNSGVYQSVECIKTSTGALNFPLVGQINREFHILAFGVVPDFTVVDDADGATKGCSLAVGTNLVTCFGTSYSFGAADIGKLFSLQGAGADVTIDAPVTTPGVASTTVVHGPLVAKITAIVSSSSFRIGANGVNAVTMGDWAIGTDNYAAIQAAIDACNAYTVGNQTRRGVVVFDAGSYAVGQTILHRNCSEQWAPTEQAKTYYFGFNSTTNTQIPGGTQPAWAAYSANTQLSAGFVRNATIIGKQGFARDIFFFEGYVDEQWRMYDTHATSATRDLYHVDGGWVNLQWFGLRGDGGGRSMFGLRPLWGNPNMNFAVTGFTYDNSKQPGSNHNSSPKTANTSTFVYLDNVRDNGAGVFSNRCGSGNVIKFRDGRIETNYVGLAGDAMFRIRAYSATSCSISLDNVTYQYVPATPPFGFPTLINYDWDTHNVGAVDPSETIVTWDDFSYSKFSAYSNSFTWNAVTYNYQPLTNVFPLATPDPIRGQTKFTSGLPGINLVPDSEFLLGSTYWTLGTHFSFGTAVGPQSDGGLVWTSTGVPETVTAYAIVTGLKELTTYSVSAYIDATYVDGAGPTPYMYVCSGAACGTIYASQYQVQGQKGIRTLTFTTAAGVSQVYLVFSTNLIQVVAPNQVIFSEPQFNLGSAANVFVPTMFAGHGGANTGFPRANIFHIGPGGDVTTDGVAYKVLLTGTIPPYTLRAGQCTNFKTIGYHKTGVGAYTLKYVVTDGTVTASADTTSITSTSNYNWTAKGVLCQRPTLTTTQDLFFETIQVGTASYTANAALTQALDYSKTWTVTLEVNGVNLDVFKPYLMIASPAE